MEIASLPMEVVEEKIEPADLLEGADVMGPWAFKQYVDKYAWKDEDGEPTEIWPDTAYRVVRYVLGALGYTDKDQEFQDLVRYITHRQFIPGGRYLATAGNPKKHQTNNCFLYKCEDSISGPSGWAQTTRKAVEALASGGGIGVVYSDVRPYGASKSSGGMGTGPLTPANLINDGARRIISGGYRRSAVWAGLIWNHEDIFDWIHEKDWPEEVRKAKEVAAENGTEAQAPLDMTNISVILDSEFFVAYNNQYHPKHEMAQRVYWEAVKNMISTGEPGFSIDIGENEGENLRNACTEITSRDDSDVCNLGSINMSRVKSIAELEDITRLATLFLLGGTVYSDIPHEEVRATREKNRRIGLGLMGVHEWMLQRKYKYEMNADLEYWLTIWKEASDNYADFYADKHNLSRPIKKRAIAPNGTIGIIAETTTSAEPLFCVAYKRRFLDTDGIWKHQYVIDPVAHRLIEEGVKEEEIEDAYSLAYNVEKRIKFQADLQKYVDHGISSTINLPYPIVDEMEQRDFGETLIKYLPKLRGITCYPDAARAGQPLVKVPYDQAHGKTGVTLEDNRDDACKGGTCGV